MLSSRLMRLNVNKIFYNYLKQERFIFRTISISNVCSDKSCTTAAVAKKTERATPYKYKWVTYGFGLNEAEDKFMMHVSFFLAVTMVLVATSFYIAYTPTETDWIQREAYIELRRREEAGGPLINRNYVDPSRIKLPSDADLGDTEIII